MRVSHFEVDEVQPVLMGDLQAASSLENRSSRCTTFTSHGKHYKLMEKPELSIVGITQTQAKQLLEDLIFFGDRPGDWVQDVWSLSPTLGESAASLVDVFDLLLGMLNDPQREDLLRKIYHNHQDVLKDVNLLDQWQQVLDG